MDLMPLNNDLISQSESGLGTYESPVIKVEDIPTIPEDIQNEFDSIMGIPSQDEQINDKLSNVIIEKTSSLRSDLISRAKDLDIKQNDLVTNKDTEINIIDTMQFGMHMMQFSAELSLGLGALKKTISTTEGLIKVN